MDTEVALKLEIFLSSPSLTAQKPNLSIRFERKQTQTLAGQHNPRIKSGKVGENEKSLIKIFS